MRTTMYNVPTSFFTGKAMVNVARNILFSVLYCVDKS